MTVIILSLLFYLTPSPSIHLYSCRSRPSSSPGGLFPPPFLSLSERESFGLQLNLLKARPLFPPREKQAERETYKRNGGLARILISALCSLPSPLTYRTPRPFVGPPSLLPLSLLFSQVKHEQSGRKGRKERRKGRKMATSTTTTTRRSFFRRTMALLYLLRLLLTPVIEGEEGRDGNSGREGGTREQERQGER